MFDSLAMDVEGNVCAATLVSERITSAPADGSAPTQYVLPPGFEDPMPTNICFGGADLRTAYITLSATGKLVSCRWPVAGLPLAFNR